MSFTELEIGQQIDSDKFILLFGNRKSELETLKKFYPHLDWSFTRQTHSSIIVPGKSSTVDPLPDSEADAQWTEKMQLALCVRTADCVPVLMISQNPEQIFSIHAGWRGVANRILPKALKQWKKAGIDLRTAKIFIGPHIQVRSFEVDLMVRDQLLASVPEKGADFDCHQTIGAKAFVDLEIILKEQAKEFGVLSEQIYSLPIDTKSDGKHFSFRREPGEIGRQISFIALK